MWDDIIAEPQYQNTTLYPTGASSGHNARGIAFASKGMIVEAEKEQVGGQRRHHCRKCVVRATGRGF